MVESFKCTVVSWGDVHEWTNDLVKKIKAAKLNLDAVIGITRGGWAPARLVCDHLVIKNLYSVKTEHWGVTATPDGTAKIAQPLTADIRNKNVLVVDDITDTGQSLKLAIDHVRELRPKSAKSATLLHITHSKIIPDFYGEIVPEKDWAWFIFPWNVNEDLQTLIPKTLETPKTIKKIRNALFMQFQIDVKEETIEPVLEVLKEKKVVKETGGMWVKK